MLHLSVEHSIQKNLTMKKYYLMVLITLITVGVSYGQITHIDSVQISPPFPTANESINVISYNFFCGGALENYSINNSNDTVTISMGYNNLIDDSCFSYIDTFNIGELEEGNYILILHLTDSDPPYYYFDSDTLSFEVQELDILELYTGTIVLFPNPVNDKLHFSTIEELKSMEIEMYNSLGELMIKESIKTKPIDISDIKDGIYFYRIIDENKNIRSEGKIVKQ